MSRLIEYFDGSTFLQPIPSLQAMDGWRELPIHESGEKLVALGAFSDYPHILSDSIYFDERDSSPYRPGELKDALITCFVREGVAEKLDAASKMLPPGYAFMVWDAYRPLAVQNTLYTDYVDKLMRTQGLSQEEAEQAALTFVNRATDAPDRPSPHHTGGSVDLTIVKFEDDVLEELAQITAIIDAARDDIKAARARGDLKAVDDAENIEYPQEMRRQELLRHYSMPIDVGANFDETKESSAVRYFEERIEAGENLNPLEFEQAMHRRVFQNILREAGFSSFPSEWWHVDSGNQFNARQTGNAAHYGPIKLSDENHQHEKMRLNHYNGTNILSQQTQTPRPGFLSKLGVAFSGIAETMDQMLARKGAAHGDMTRTGHERACRL